MSQADFVWQAEFQKVACLRVGSMRRLICVTDGHMGTWTWRLTSSLCAQSHHLASLGLPKLLHRPPQPSQLSSRFTSDKTEAPRGEVAASGNLMNEVQSWEGDACSLSPHSRTFLYPARLSEGTEPVFLLSCLGGANFFLRLHFFFF